MLHGDSKYGKIDAKIHFDDDLLVYLGYQNLSGVVASAKIEGADRVSLSSMPSSNVILGASCDPAVKIVTLKFKVKSKSADTDLSFDTLNITAVPIAIGATTAPPEPLPLPLLTGYPLSCDHDWLEAAVVAPTCVDQGYTVYECLLCGEFTSDDFLPALGHTEGTGVITTPAVCEVAGEMTYYCSVCNAELRSAPIPALVHDWVEMDITPQGYIMFKCSQCGEVK